MLCSHPTPTPEAADAIVAAAGSAGESRFEAVAFIHWARGTLPFQKVAARLAKRERTPQAWADLFSAHSVYVPGLETMVKGCACDNPHILVRYGTYTRSDA